MTDARIEWIARIGSAAIALGLVYGLHSRIGPGIALWVGLMSGAAWRWFWKRRRQAT